MDALNLNFALKTRRGGCALRGTLNSAVRLGGVAGFRASGETGNLISMGELWEQKRSRAARDAAELAECEGILG